jgi:UDP-glucose 4-epimerase
MVNTVLITGGAGYIGSHAVKCFLEKGHDVIVFDNLSTGHQTAIEVLKKYGTLSFVKGDLLNPQDLEETFSKHQIHTVLHFAAFCSVNESMENPALYFRNNVMGSLNLLDAMKIHAVKNMIFSSTCATYGEAKYVPVDELHSQTPTNPYGESKLMVEKLISWYSRSYGIKSVIFRYFNVCGADPQGVIGDSKRPSPHLVQNVVRGALGIAPFKMECPKVDTPDGTPIRDYVDVNDLVLAHYLAYGYLNKGNDSNVFNLGTGSGYSVKQIIDQVEKVLDVKIPVSSGNTRKGEYAEIFASFDKAKKILGWEPTRTLADSIKSLKKWYEAMPQGF